MSADAEDVIDEGASGVQEAGGVAAYARQIVIGGSLRAIAIGLVTIILGLAEAIFRPFRSFVDGVSSLITGTFGGPVIINEAGALAAASSFESGTAALLGPFAWPAAVFVSMAGVFVFIWFLQRIDLSPLAIFRDDGD